MYDFISTHFWLHNEFHSVHFNESHQSVTHPLACNENSLVKRQQKNYISYRQSSDLQPIIRFNNYPFSTLPTSKDIKKKAAAVCNQKHHPTNLTAGYFRTACTVLMLSASCLLAPMLSKFLLQFRRSKTHS